MAEEKGPVNLPATALLDAMGEIAEMRRAYTAIEKSFPDLGPRSIVVTSASVSEGKTLTAAGLATVATREGERRVLAVDLNWFRPALHTVFGLERTFDIDRIRDDRGVMDLTQASKIDHLDVLVAPLPEQNSVEAGAGLNLLAEKIIKQAHEAYDISIIDTAALYPINRRMVDPAVFSRSADGVALVVLAHETPRRRVKRALMALKTSGAEVLGVVVNQWERALV